MVICYKNQRRNGVQHHYEPTTKRRNNMKSYSAVIALVSFAFVASLLLTTGTDAANSTWGYVNRYDRLLYRENVKKSSSFLQVTSIDVIYPPKNHIGYYTISAITAIDHKKKDGGHAYLYRGGPGYRNATIHLKSERNHGLNFTVEIYGH